MKIESLLTWVFNENEIKIMEHKLDEVLANPYIEKGNTKVENLNHQLNIKNDDSFFQHLQSFESTFKVIRQEVLDRSI
ncbi:MAG: hypothetical protein JWQ09_4977 [Segetibacter sp.]|nr:hypothetical protein [Segetibacter sp.]